MQWLLFGALILGTPLALASSSAEVPIEVVMDDCGSHAMPQVRLLESALHLIGLRPGTSYLIEIHEYGIDLRIADGDGGWINSSPASYSSEPIALSSDRQGQGKHEIRIADQRTWARLTIVIQCTTSAGSVSAPLARRAELAALMATAITRGSEIAAMHALGKAFESIWRSDNPSKERLWTLFQLAELAAWGGQPTTQASWLELAIEQSIALKVPLQQGWATRELASALLRSGNPAAGEAFSDALRAAQVLDLPDLAAHAAVGRCILLRAGGDAAAAAECYVDGIRQFAVLHDSDSEASARNNRATALLFLGRYGEARVELDRAQLLTLGGGDERMAARIALVMAQLARWDGDFERALSLLHEVLAMQLRLGRSADIAKAQRLIAHTYELADEPARAEHYFRAAAISAEQRDDAPGAATALLALAGRAADRLDSHEAMALLERSEPWLSKLDAARDGGFNLWRKLRVEMSLGHSDRALVTLQRLAGIRHAMQWRNQIRLDALQVQLGASPPGYDARQELLPALHKAMERADLTLLLDLAEALLTDYQRRGDHEAMRSLARLAIDQGTRVAARVRSPALRHAVLAKLKGFAELPLWQLQEGSVETAEALAALSDLELLRAVEQRPFDSVTGDNTLIELERTLADADLGDPTGSPEREALLLQLTAVEARADNDRGNADRAARPLPPALPQMGDEEALLYLVTTDDQAGAMVLDHRGWRWHGGIDAAQLLEATQTLLGLLESGHGSRQAIDQQAARVARSLGWDRLFEFAPKRLSVVLDGHLAALPWALLPAPGDPSGLLIERTELVVLQSLRSTPISTITRLYLGAAAAPSGVGLPALAQAAAELDHVAGHWSDLPQVRYPTINRLEFTRALADPGALVHLAAHGRGDRGRLEDAGLWLADDGGRPVFVSTLRLRRLPVHAGLVVLGACETGASAAARTFGVGAVAGSLIDAGADAVVATRWPVSDRVALAFADAFHAALAVTPTDPAAALRKAQLALRRTPSARHPTHWAGWFLLRSGMPPVARQASAQDEWARPGFRLGRMLAPSTASPSPGTLFIPAAQHVFGAHSAER
jgi:hypothetical protein